MIDWKKYIGATILVASTSTLATSEPPTCTDEDSCCSSATDTSLDANCDGSCLTDTAEVQSDDNDQPLVRTVLRVEGMTCDGCVSRLEKQIFSIKGVEDVGTNLVSGIVWVGGTVKEDSIIKAVESAGFKGSIIRDAIIKSGEDGSGTCETSDCSQAFTIDTNSVSAADLEAADITILEDSLSPVIAQFNKDSDKRRVVALLSPTCGGCVYAAKAVQKEIIQAYPDEDLSIIIVWEPMLGSDNENAARMSSLVFNDPRVHQFYDENRLSGAAYSRDLFPTVTEDMLGSISKDHFLREYIEKGLNKRPENKPLWDVVYFYGEDIKWNDTPPESESWSKQIMFQSGAIEKKPSLFWVDSYKNSVKKSDWYLEIRDKMNELLKDESAFGPGSPAETKATLVSLSETEQPVVDWFNKRNGKLRFIALLSPS